MALSQRHLARIHQALLPAFARDEFRRVVAACLETDFDAVAPEKGFSDQLWTFLAWANRQGKALAVARCADIRPEFRSQSLGQRVNSSNQKTGEIICAKKA